MKDNLEKYILNNKEDFDVFDPGDELWEGIQKQSTPVRKLNWHRISWQVAAAVALFIASYYFHALMDDKKDSDLAINEKQFEDPQDEKIQVLMEAEVFYTSKINSAREEVIRLSGDDKGLMEILNLDLVELDDVFSELKNDLKDNNDNEEVIEAMIQNYRMKLEILEEMLQQLNKSKQTEDKNKGYEI